DVGCLHGALSNIEKQVVMEKFKDGKYQILVTTTIIEVGIDVKKANGMIVYDAQRFGLSQLHQLRGRVGRGDCAGYFYMLSDSDDERVVDRLSFLASQKDGYKISLYDLKYRGFGELLGAKQSGQFNFKYCDFITDENLITNIYQIVKKLFDKNLISDKMKVLVLQNIEKVD
ncbi:MAG: helicase-related protein, partial [Erysipelotrichaceae bacterium]